MPIKAMVIVLRPERIYNSRLYWLRGLARLKINEGIEK